MDIQEQEIQTKAIKYTIEEDGNVVGRVSLFFIVNDLHEEPYGLIEDVFVDDTQRGKGIGTKLIQHVIDEAKKHGCRKLIAQSRYGKNGIHLLYERLGFTDHGKNFRMDFLQ